jgi:hypothetical protein
METKSIIKKYTCYVTISISALIILHSIFSVLLGSTMKEETMKKIKYESDPKKVRELCAEIIFSEAPMKCVHSY